MSRKRKPSRTGKSSHANEHVPPVESREFPLRPMSEGPVWQMLYGKPLADPPGDLFADVIHKRRHQREEVRKIIAAEIAEHLDAKVRRKPKNASRRKDALHVKRVNELMPRFRQGFKIIRSIHGPDADKRRKSVLLREGFKESEIATLMKSRKAESAVATYVAELEGISPRTIQNAVSLSKRVAG